MYTLIRNTPRTELLAFRLPALAASLVIAELFYKFHSFALEALAFLGTWFALDFAAAVVESALRRRD